LDPPEEQFMPASANPFYWIGYPTLRWPIPGSPLLPLRRHRPHIPQHQQAAAHTKLATASSIPRPGIAEPWEAPWLGILPMGSGQGATWIGA